MKTQTVLQFALAGALMTLSPLATAQTTGGSSPVTPAATPDPTIEALTRQQKISALEKQIAVDEQAKAEAEKAKFAAKLPVTADSGVAGSVTFNAGSGYFAEMLAYESMVGAAALVAEAVGNPATKDDPILVVANADLPKQAQLWEIASARLDDAIRRLVELSNAKFTVEAAGLAVTAASTLLGAAADIASFFRSDLTVTSRAVNISSTALVAATAASLKAKDWGPIVPSLALAKTGLLEKVEALLDARLDLVEHRRTLEGEMQKPLGDLALLLLDLEAAQANLKEISAAKPPDPTAINAAELKVLEVKAKMAPFSQLKGRWEKFATEIDTALAATDALVNALVQGAEGKPSALEAVAAVDVAKRESNAGVPILQLETSSQGGEMHVSKSVWRTRLTYIGGVAVSYLMLEHSGAVKKSGVIAKPIAKSSKASMAAARLTPPPRETKTQKSTTP